MKKRIIKGLKNKAYERGVITIGPYYSKEFHQKMRESQKRKKSKTKKTNVIYKIADKDDPIFSEGWTIVSFRKNSERSNDESK